jgi:hypothetical protein
MSGISLTYSRMTRKTYVWYIPDIYQTYDQVTRKTYVWYIPDIFQTYDQMTRKRYARHISRYQVYLEICMTYYTIVHIPGIYHGYLTSTDSRCCSNLERSYTVYVLAYTFLELEHHIQSYTIIYCHKVDINRHIL